MVFIHPHNITREDHSKVLELLKATKSEGKVPTTLPTSTRDANESRRLADAPGKAEKANGLAREREMIIKCEDEWNKIQHRLLMDAFFPRDGSLVAMKDDRDVADPLVPFPPSLRIDEKDAVLFKIVDSRTRKVRMLVLALDGKRWSHEPTITDDDLIESFRPLVPWARETAKEIYASGSTVNEDPIPCYVWHPKSAFGVCSGTSGIHLMKWEAGEVKPGFPRGLVERLR